MNKFHKVNAARRYVMNNLSRFQSQPNVELWRALKRLLKYVKKTINFVLLYTLTKDDSSSKPLVGYADAADRQDTSDRKSTSGYLCMYSKFTIILLC